MTLWQAILLGLLQGVTEFLPVSSSGHLVILPHVLNWPDPGLVMDSMLHLGTLIAIVAYFFDDLWRLFRAAWKSIRTRSLNEADARMAWTLVLATIPAAVIGFLLEDVFENLFGAPKAAAGFLLGTAALLVFSELASKRIRPINAISWFEALIIGLAQTLAIAPGLSRSGSTISAGMLLGFKREDATRFSFWLAVPIMAGAGAYQVLKLLAGMPTQTPIGLIIVAMIVAMVSGYLAIAFLLGFVKKHSLIPFAVYCVLLSVLVLAGVLG